MAVNRSGCHRRSCSHSSAASKKRKEMKGWPGPVFANEMGVGWTKLNAVRACSRCRIRHVKCSLIHTGGPCTHCRKRKESCEVLGWQLEPGEASKTIYKYVLPPPHVPSPTPKNSVIEAELDQQLDLEELCQRLGQLRPRRLASIWPWGPDDHEPFYPMGPQFGEEHPEEWCCCPARQLNKLGLRAPSENDSFSPTYSLELDYQPPSSNAEHAPFNGDCYGDYQRIQPSGAVSVCSQDDSNHNNEIDQIKHPFSDREQGLNRMSLRFILNTDEVNL